MNKFNFKNPIFIITTIFFLATVVFGLFLLWPKFQEVRTIRQSIETKKATIQEREAHFLRKEEEARKLQGLEEQLSKIATALPNNAQMSLPPFFRFLQRAGAETGLILGELGSFTIIPAAEGAEIQKIQFSFQAIGSYDSLKAFLKRIEGSARIISVENISFSFVEEGELFTFNLTVTAHSY